MQGLDDSLYYSADSYVVIATCMDHNCSSDEARIAFAWYQMVVVFLLPAVTMAYCYTFVINVLWLSTKKLAILMQVDRYAPTNLGNCILPALPWDAAVGLHIAVSPTVCLRFECRKFKFSITQLVVQTRRHVAVTTPEKLTRRLWILFLTCHTSAVTVMD